MTAHRHTRPPVMAGADTLEENAATFRRWWAHSDHVLVGAGAGLSAAAGLDYGDREDFARTFPALVRRGFTARYEMIGYDGFTPAQHWAYWATHVSSLRFGPRPHPVYQQLLELVTGKDPFVLTTNVDAMFTRNGFDAARLYTPQGDYAAMQCRTPCRPVVWPSRPDLERALACIDAERFEVTDPDAIPRCPHCGGEVFLNVRGDHSFVDTPYDEQRQRMERWFEGASEGRLLLLEIGAGFNTPVWIRWPMERVLARHPGARLVRINLDHSEVPEATADRSISLAVDAGRALEVLRQVCV